MSPFYTGNLFKGCFRKKEKIHQNVNTMINERAKYTANTGIVSISTANSNRNGTGTLGVIITGASNGTLVKRIIIKATGNTTRGMVRIYCNANIITEVEVPAVTKSAIDTSFSAVLNLNFKLASTNTLKASTQNAETFIITAEGLDWTY